MLSSPARVYADVMHVASPDLLNLQSNYSSDADSDVLADYVLALIRSDAPDDEIRQASIENLEDFLKESSLVNFASLQTFSTDNIKTLYSLSMRSSRNTDQKHNQLLLSLPSKLSLKRL